MNETACLIYNAVALLGIDVQSGDTLDDVLAKINTAIEDLQGKTDYSELDMSAIELDPAVVTPQEFLQKVIDEIASLKSRMADVEEELSDLPGTLMDVVVPIDVRALSGGNSCAPAAPVTMGQLLSLLLTQVADIKKKDYSKNSCDDTCGVVLAASGGFVECFTVPPGGDGDFDARDFFDRDFYAI